MIYSPNASSSGVVEQQSIRAKSFHPMGTFMPFEQEQTEQSIPDRFEQQVRWHANRLSVKTRSHELTYDALNQSANRVAQAILSRRGAGEEPIALLLEKGAPLIAAILGVLKAGKIYVPLDPSYPRARNKYILKDSQASLMVTNDQNLSSAREMARPGCQVINVQELDTDLPAENPGLSLSPDRVAYILYTSGSTGQPKGVVQTHRNVLHEAMNNTNGLHICSDDRLALLSSCAFSDAGRTIYGALLNGASLYPLDMKDEGLAYLATWLVQHEITIYRSVATTFRHFAGTLTGKTQFPHLRLVVLGGEPAYQKDAEMYKRHFSPQCVLVNVLGATECISYRWYFVDKDTSITGNNVPAGYTMTDKEALLMDDAGQQVGFNQIGEIAVRSRYLSPGYWRRPDLTQMAFFPDPDEGPGRIYRTGDLGLMLDSGCLVHMGRKDFQVKVRGYRVEVAEIENALLDLDNIQEACVAPRQDLPGEQRLVAYIVPAQRPAPNVTELRTGLTKRLPDYMVPSAFVMLEALPRLPNGKLDRLALSKPGRSRPNLASPFVAPRTPEEGKLAAIWAHVLGLDEVGIDDNFLELGGDSLLATQAISRVINTFDVGLPPGMLFTAPTVAQMAVVVAQHQANQAKLEDVERLLAELEGLSDDQATQILAREGAGRHEGRP